MFVYTDHYLQILSECWEKYVQNGEPIPARVDTIRPDILDSWRRCQEYGVPSDYDISHNPSLSKLELKKVLDQNAVFMSVARPYLENIFRFVDGSNYILHLMDQHGHVLQYHTTDALIQNLNDRVENLQVGSIRNEQLTGTSSPAICLVTHKPVHVYGQEHYPHHGQNFFCCSAPVFDAHDQFLGVLTMFGPKELYQSHTLGMVCAAADAIQRGMRMKAAYDELSIANALSSITIESLSSSIILLNENQQVIRLNQNAEKLLAISQEDALNKLLSHMIDLSSLPKKLHQLDIEAKNTSCVLLTASNKKIDVLLTMRLIKSEQQNRKIVVMIIEEQQAINKLASQISGFTAIYTFDAILGHSDAAHNMRKIGKAAAKSASNVLILGESGCGKELLAQAIHNASDRANGPFVAVNCGSIPHALIESELFGYEGGAFTGARREGCPGKFELAHSGTIFLDEIGDMPLELQVSLLRVLQERQIMRIGGKYQQSINVRLIAATNSNLWEKVQRKEFRSDLYYRLNVLNIMMPPLRDRADDILLLATHFMQVCNAAMNKSVTVIDDEAEQILTRYDWPGNVRELENTIERAINLAPGKTITIHELPGELLEQTLSPCCDEFPVIQNQGASQGIQPKDGPDPIFAALPTEGAEPPKSPQILEYTSIVSALTKEKGHAISAAEDLGIPVRQLYRKVKKYNIDLHRFRKWD